MKLNFKTLCAIGSVLFGPVDAYLGACDQTALDTTNKFLKFSQIKETDSSSESSEQNSAVKHIKESDWFHNLKKLTIDPKSLGHLIARMDGYRRPLKSKDINALEELIIVKPVRWSTIKRALRYFPTVNTISFDKLNQNDDWHDAAEIEYFRLVYDEEKNGSMGILEESMNVFDERPLSNENYNQYINAIKLGDHKEINSVLEEISQLKDVEINVDQKETALTGTVSFASEDPVSIINVLIQGNKDANTQNYDGKTPLMIALERGYIESAESLLTVSTVNSINSQDKKGKSALFYAITSEEITNDSERLEIVKLLIENGAIPNQEVLDLAKNSNYEQIFNELNKVQFFDEAVDISILADRIVLRGNLKKIKDQDEILQHLGISKNSISKTSFFNSKKLSLKELEARAKKYLEISDSSSDSDSSDWDSFDWDSFDSDSSDSDSSDSDKGSIINEQQALIEKKEQEERNKKNLILSDIWSFISRYSLNEKINSMYPWEIAFVNKHFADVALLLKKGAVVKSDAKFLSYNRSIAEKELAKANKETKEMWKEINAALNVIND